MYSSSSAQFLGKRTLHKKPNNSHSTHQQQRYIRDVLTASQVNTHYGELPESAYVFGSVLKDAESLLALMSSFGGNTVRIPRSWPPRGYAEDSNKVHPLRKVLSVRQIQKIIAYFGGTEVYIPKCTRYMAMARNASIIDAFSKGIKTGTSSRQVVQKLARRFELSDRRVWDILKTPLHTNIKPPISIEAEDGEMCTFDIDIKSHTQ